MITGIIVGHRNISEALLEALESINGAYENIIPISNNGLSTDEIIEKIKTASANGQDDGTVIFVDVFGGSCWQAAKRAKLPKCCIITGLNLPMLLSFVNKRETLSFDDLPSVLETDGKRGIKLELRIEN